MRALLLALAACTTPFSPAVVYVVAPAVSQRMSGDACESALTMPVGDCMRGASMRYDGCHWRCTPWFGFPLRERQSECASLTVNGYLVEECPTSEER